MIAKWVRALTALADDLLFIISIHVVTQNHL